MFKFSERINQFSIIKISNPLSATGSNSNGRIFLSTKLNNSNSSETKYIYKELDKDDHPFIASCEATMSDCYQIIAPEITPDVEVIANNSKLIAIISKQVENYKSYGDCSSYELEQLLSNKKKELAALLVSAYVTADDDLHDDNWGFSLVYNDNNNIDFEKSKIVKIDNDLAAFSHTFQYSGRALRAKDIDIITDFPNRSYRATQAFDISIYDIKKFPLLTLYKSNHWPFRKNTSFAEFLYHDDEFQNAKFFYFTKALLLNNKLIRNITNAHSLKTDKNKSEKLVKYLSNRISKLKNCLISMPEYHQHLFTAPNLINYILAEIGYYNKKFFCGDSINIDTNLQAQIISDEHVIKTITNLMITCRSRAQNPKLKKTEALIINTEILNSIEKEKECIQYLKSLGTDSKLSGLVEQRTQALHTFKCQLGNGSYSSKPYK